MTNPNRSPGELRDDQIALILERAERSDIPVASIRSLRAIFQEEVMKLMEQYMELSRSGDRRDERMAGYRLEELRDWFRRLFKVADEEPVDEPSLHEQVRFWQREEWEAAQAQESDDRMIDAVLERTGTGLTRRELGDMPHKFATLIEGAIWTYLELRAAQADQAECDRAFQNVGRTIVRVRRELGW